MRKLFGTDGIRGKANHYPMTPEMALKVGRAVGFLFHPEKGAAEVVVGKDTRISGDMIESALAAGICSAGASARMVGVMPTPGIAYVTRATAASAGIVISASHNPYEDNGIKVFDQNGFKLSDETELRLEQMILSDSDAYQGPSSPEAGRKIVNGSAGSDYIRFLAGLLRFQGGLKGMRIVLDCSNGATYELAPRLFAELGAEVDTIFIEPNGTNINRGCGSQNTAVLSKKVVETGADVGFAFDGDGDRLIAADEKGKKVTGDQMLAVFADFMHRNGLLKNNIVVSTVMSNLGLRLALEEMGVENVTTDVGDRYVLDAMQRNGAVLGGEDSGHLIFLDRHTTGDGILTALRLAEVMKTSARCLSRLTGVMRTFPQVLVNVEVDQKPDLSDIPEIKEQIDTVEKRLGEKGRVLVRYSGTRPLCRVMVEGPTEELTRESCERIVHAVKKTIGRMFSDETADDRGQKS